MTKGSFVRIGMALAVVAGVIFLLGMCCGEGLVNKLAFFPERGMQVDPARLDASVESVFVRTEDGVKVSGFYLPRGGATRSILFFHGNAGNASHRLRDAEALWELDANVLLMDYRGYGLSEGDPSEQGVYLDGEAGLRFLTDLKEIPLGSIVIYGRSLGSAVAVHLCQNRNIAGMVLAAPLSSGREVASKSGLGCMGPSIGEPFDSKTKIASLKAPLLIIHGTQDSVLPISMGRSLFEVAPANKEFVEVEGAGHNDLVSHNPRRFYASFRAFLDRVAP